MGARKALERLDKLGDPWQVLDENVDFEAFREILEECWRPANIEPTHGGRPAWDAVLMFKILLIGRKTGWSDEHLERALLNHLDLQRFTGLTIGEQVPDCKTIWFYRDRLDRVTVRDLFEAFDRQLAAKGLKAADGQMVDASFVLVPIQRNTREENATIKEGKTPAAWQEDQATAKLRQKDVDARWTQKNGKSFYGYKLHANVDVKHKLIRGLAVTPAQVADVTALQDLVDPTQKSQPLYADAAYRSAEEERELRALDIRSRVTFKRSKGEELTSYKKRENKKRAKVRARVSGDEFFFTCGDRFFLHIC